MTVGRSTICLPISKEAYPVLVDSPQQFRGEHRIRQEAGKADAVEKLRCAGQGEDEELEQRVRDPHDTQAGSEDGDADLGRG